MEERVGGLENRVVSLENRVSGLEAKVDALVKDVNELRKGQEELRDGFNALKRDMEDVKERLGRLKERVDKLDRTMENLTLGLEAEANSLVSNYLRRRGINIDTDRVQLDFRYEFDIYGTNGQVTIVGEAKIRVSAAIIDRVVARVREAMKEFPDKFPGKVVIVVYCMRALPDAVEKAKELGVWLIEVGNERTPFPG